MRSLAIVVCVAACGDGLPPELPDAPDAYVDDRARVAVVFRGDVDTANVRVIFQNPDSTIALVTRPDDRGRANALVQSGGFVSVVFDGDALTYVRVEDGQELWFERWSGDAALTAVRVRVPELVGAQSYQLESSCGSREIFGAQIQPLDVSLGDCGDAADVLVTAKGAGIDQFVFRNEVPLQGQTVTFMGPYAPVERGTIAVESLPIETTAVIAEQTLVRGGDSLMPFRKTAIGIINGGGSGGLVFTRPAAATLLTHIEPADGPLHAAHLIEWQPAERDIALLWPGFPIRPYTSPPTFSAETSSLSWGEGVGNVADGIHAELSWLDDDRVRHTWEILAPHEETTLALPVLPFAEMQPRAETMSVTRFDSFGIEGGYERARGAFRLGRRLERGTWFTDSERGRVVYQALD